MNAGNDELLAVHRPDETRLVKDTVEDFLAELSPEDAHDLLAVVLELGLDYPEWHLSLEVW